MIANTQPTWMKDKMPSMKRRANFHDYKGRAIYLITIATEGRKALLGSLANDMENPHVELSPLGEEIQSQILNIPNYYPQIRILGQVVMPDHVHFVAFVKEAIPVHLGKVISGFKAGCNRIYAAKPHITEQTEEAKPHITEQKITTEQQIANPKTYKLFEDGYTDSVLTGIEQLEHMLAYIQDNPRRLLVKHVYPELFRIVRDKQVAGNNYDLIGNNELLSSLKIKALKISRNIPDAELEKVKNGILDEARNGAVIVSPFISQGERVIREELMACGLPFIWISEQGLSEYYKPVGKLFDHCANGHLLILAPWKYQTERQKLTREQCLQLNEMANGIERFSTAKPLNTRQNYSTAKPLNTERTNV